MLREAKEQCDPSNMRFTDRSQALIEKKKLLVQTLVERYTQLIALSYVDEIIPLKQKKI